MLVPNNSPERNLHKEAYNSISEISSDLIGEPVERSKYCQK